MSQLTMSFDPGLPERFGTLRAFVAHRANVTQKALKAQAADMDIGPSTLSRKLNPSDGDTQRFNLDDLEQWLGSTGEVSAVIEYLSAKYLDNDTQRQARVLARVETMLPELAQLVAALKGPK